MAAKIKPIFFKMKPISNIAKSASNLRKSNLTCLWLSMEYQSQIHLHPPHYVFAWIYPNELWTKRGRPRKKWMEAIKENLKRLEIEDWISRAIGRKKLRKIIQNFKAMGLYFLLRWYIHIPTKTNQTVNFSRECQTSSA